MRPLLAVALPLALLAPCASAARSRSPTLVYMSRQTNLELVVVSLSSRTMRPLVARAGDDEQAAPSPDGRRLAFVSDRDGDDEICVAGPTGRTRSS